MNTVRTFEKEQDTIHFTSRNGDYRIVVESTNEHELPVIAKFLSEDIQTLKDSDCKMLAIQNIESNLQNSVSVSMTVFNHEEKSILFELKDVSLKFSFQDNEWEQIKSLNWGN